MIEYITNEDGYITQFTGNEILDLKLCDRFGNLQYKLIESIPVLRPIIDRASLEKEEITTLSTYLASTGWYSERASDYVESGGLYGKPTPPEILTARQAARERISELKEAPQ